MKPLSDRTLRQIIGALTIPAVLLLVSSQVFVWRAHHFAEVPRSHIVGIEPGGRPYMRPTGWPENRTTITRRQFEAYQRNMRVVRALGPPGVALFLSAVLLGVSHRWQKKPAPTDDLA